MDVNDPVVIQTTTSVGEAALLKIALETEGIKCELEGENQGSLAGILGVRILVRAWDEERARKVLSWHGQHCEHHGEHS